MHRVAGLGSLGRQRLTAIGQFEGGYIAREVKQLAPPASLWATGKGSRQIRYGEILKNSVRCGDPFLRQQDNWIGRRLSPSNSRIEIVDLPKEKDVERLLHAMGFETANIHLGSIQRKKLKKALERIKPTDRQGCRAPWKMRSCATGKSGGRNEARVYSDPLSVLAASTYLAALGCSRSIPPPARSSPAGPGRPRRCA